MSVRRKFYLWMVGLGMCLLLGGCAERWTKPGATQAEFQAMTAGCESRSYARFPPLPRPVQISDGYFTPVQRVCSAGPLVTRCGVVGGDYVPPSFMLADVNEGARVQDVRRCFVENGWQPVRN